MTTEQKLIKNRVSEETESAVVAIALEDPSLGQTRASEVLTEAQLQAMEKAQEEKIVLDPFSPWESDPWTPGPLTWSTPAVGKSLTWVDPRGPADRIPLVD